MQQEYHCILPFRFQGSDRTEQQFADAAVWLVPLQTRSKLTILIRRVRIIERSDYYLSLICPSLCPSTLPHGTTQLSTGIIKQFSSNTSCFIVCEATCFGPYMTIIRPSYESSPEILATCWDPNYVYN